MNQAPVGTKSKSGVIYHPLIEENDSVFPSLSVPPRPPLELNGETAFYLLGIVLMLMALGALLFYFWGVLTG